MNALNRRQFVANAALLSATAPLLPAWAKSNGAANLNGIRPLSGQEFQLTADRTPVSIDGREGRAITINGELPAPLLRWREGDEVTLHLSNRLRDDTSIHWHGILLPPEMDGVPGLSGFRGVAPGDTFTYRFALKQAGTYWYHSHSGFQEQLGHYGPIIIDPASSDPTAYDREYVVVLSDWTFMDPKRLFARLKKKPEVFNRQKRTLVDFFRDARSNGLDDAVDERAMWGAMRMDPADIADVTAEAYTYLINGHGPGDNWTAIFNPGERVRLRIINASAMTIFNVRIPGLPVSVVQADGLNVNPVETDEFQIGVAETYDIVVHPRDDRAYTLMAETIDRSGFARATLAPRAGMEAAVPSLRERPTLSMQDMAMAHHDGHDGAQDKNDAPMDHRSMDHGSIDHGAMEHGGGDHGGTSMKTGKAMNGHDGHDMSPHNGPKMAKSNDPVTHDHPRGVGVDMVAQAPQNRLDHPGLGLDDVDHRVLTYAQLQALDRNPDRRAPEREIELHLTGNMHRYMWSFDGVKFSDAKEPIVFTEGERARLTMVNDTMMSHPIHLHGMFFDVVNDAGAHKPRKHTLIVKPGEKVSVDITADAVGDWAFHCHLLYHMAAGMMRVVSVKPAQTPHRNDHEQHEDHSSHAMDAS